MPTACSPATLDLRAAVVDEARRWQDTPVRHRGRTIGKEVDCLGLAWAVGEACGVLDDLTPRFEPFAAYGRIPRTEQMREGLATFLVPAPAGAPPLPGDVGFVSWHEAQVPIHLVIFGLLFSRMTIIHADGTPRVRKVVEVTYAGVWPNRLDSVWRYPGLA